VNRLLIILLIFVSTLYSYNHHEYFESLVSDFDKTLCDSGNADSLQNCYLLLIDPEFNSSSVSCIPALKAREYLSKNFTKNLKFWEKHKGYFKKDHYTEPVDKEFLAYSDEYLKWLEEYSLTNEGKWISSYVKKYPLVDDISPSMIVEFYSIIRKQNFRDYKVRGIFLVHFLTLSYNYCE